jgi:hypothetical protein
MHSPQSRPYRCLIDRETTLHEFEYRERNRSVGSLMTPRQSEFDV